MVWLLFTQEWGCVNGLFTPSGVGGKVVKKKKEIYKESENLKRQRKKEKKRKKKNTALGGEVISKHPRKTWRGHLQWSSCDMMRAEVRQQ